MWRMVVTQTTDYKNQVTLHVLAYNIGAVLFKIRVIAYFISRVCVSQDTIKSRAIFSCLVPDVAKSRHFQWIWAFCSINFEDWIEVRGCYGNNCTVLSLWSFVTHTLYPWGLASLLLDCIISCLGTTFYFRSTYLGTTFYFIYMWGTMQVKCGEIVCWSLNVGRAFPADKVPVFFGPLKLFRL